MLRIFRKSKAPVAEIEETLVTSANPGMQTQTMRDAIDLALKEKPYLYQQVTGRELHANITEVLSGEDERPMETALAIMSSMAGFACLYPVHRKYERGEISPDHDGFRVEIADSGQRMFFGDLITDRLIHEDMSLTSMVKDKAKSLGVINFPDPTEILENAKASITADVFGEPRLPAINKPRDLPSNFVRFLMPSYLPLLQRYDRDAEKFRISLGFAIQHLMDDAAEFLDPDLISKIVLECAIPMASLDPAEVY